MARPGAAFDLARPLLYSAKVVYHDAGDDEELDEETSAADPATETEDPTSGDPSSGKDRRRRFERVLPEILKRAIEKGLETGLGTLTNSSEALRGVVKGVELPKEIANYVLGQVDETKNAMTRVVAREVREFLEAADLSKELQKALLALSFEIRTEIRFIPNDAGGLKPNVKAHVGPSPRKGGKRRGLRRPSSTEDESDAVHGDEHGEGE